MIKTVHKVVCDNCGWETTLDMNDNYLFEAIDNEHYIRYGDYHFCCKSCKKEFLEKNIKNINNE